MCIFLLQFLSFDIVSGEVLNRSQYDINQIKNLPQSEVNVVYEDQRGFVWIGTLDGLFRYDGVDYRAFQIDETDQSLKSNMILAIDEDSEGDIWVGTYGRGVSCVNPETGEVANYDFQDILPQEINFNDVVSIEIDRDDNMWIANWYYILKIKLSDLKNSIDSVICYPISEQQIEDKDFINVIHEDRLGNIWFGSNRIIRRLKEERDGELICDNFEISCMDICDYSDDSIIIVGDNLEMLAKCGDEYRVTHLRNSMQNATKVICEDSSNIWVGTRNGVVHINKIESGEWKLVMRHTKDIMPFDMPASVVSSMMLSKNNQVWVGTRGGGVFTIGSRVKLFNNYPANSRSVNDIPSQIIKALYEDTNGDLWVGTEENGVYYQSFRDGVKRTNLEVNRADDRAYSFEQTGDISIREVMWVGTSFPANLVAIDMKSLKPIEQDETLTSIGFVFALCKSDDNTLWAGTYNNGLWRLTLDDYGKILSSQQFNTLNSTISSNIIRSLYISTSGDLLVGTDMGICRVDKMELSCENPQFSRNLFKDKSTTVNHYILQITESSCGDMLIGTMGHGLLRYDVESDRMSSITTADGLANGSVKSIVEDPKSGDIWLSTNRGISRYTPSNEVVVNYDENDGLRDCEFSEICGIRRASGEILFGNRFGFVSFDPESIKSSDVTPKLYFTELYINHKLVGVGADKSTGREILSKTLEYTSHIDLEYDERNFSIEFVGLNFASPLGNKYYIQLEDMESEWREIRGEELVAQYTNVPEGDYRFRVRAANSDGVWSDDELDLSIHIAPPLSRSMMAYTFYFVLVLLMAYCAYWVFSAISRRKQQVLIAQMEQSRAEEMVQYKLEFFTNISHEFRTPLTLINIPLEKLLSKREQIKDLEMVEDVAEMKYNVDMLLSLVNQLIDFRKIERGKEYVKPVCTNLVGYMHSYFEHFNMLAQKQNIEYHFTTQQSSIGVDIDVRLFEKVVVNILSNALKYTPQGGRVELMVDHDETRGLAIITLKDNGHGIAKDEVPLLFDRFYQGKNQSESASNVLGSGIGLSLTKSIVELHNGTMRIESDIDQGFTCIIELPISKEEPSDSPQMDSTPIIIEPKYVEVATKAEPSSGEKRDRILIVDDNERLRVQLSRQLGDVYDVITAENGLVGLESCLKELPSLVIADIMMPVMDGIEMCRRIKEDESISHTPIMVLTANTTIKNQIDSFTIGGADGYLDKPFNLDILKSKIATILHNREILKEKFQRQTIIEPEEFATSAADLKCISKIVDIIKEHMSDSELSIEMIAAEYGVSRIYLNRKIKALTGVTTTQFLRNIRMKYAAQLLLQKQMNVTEIAWAVGYTDVRAFRIRFKEVFGVSPTNYSGEEGVSGMGDLSLGNEK